MRKMDHPKDKNEDRKDRIRRLVEKFHEKECPLCGAQGVNIKASHRHGGSKAMFGQKGRWCSGVKEH